MAQIVANGCFDFCRSLAWPGLRSGEPQLPEPATCGKRAETQANTQNVQPSTPSVRRVARSCWFAALGERCAQGLLPGRSGAKNLCQSVCTGQRLWQLTFASLQMQPRLMTAPWGRFLRLCNRSTTQVSDSSVKTEWPAKPSAPLAIGSPSDGTLNMKV